MRLIVDRRSPNCAKVLAVAAHLGMVPDCEEIDLSRGDQRSSHFLSLNLLGQVPAAVDGCRVLVESNAIIQYLADETGDRQLWPGDPWGRALVSRWLHWSSAQLAPAIRPFHWERLFKRLTGGGEPDLAVLAGAESAFLERAAGLEVALGQKTAEQGVGGTLPTLADFSIAAMLIYAEPAAVPLAAFPNMMAWRERIMALPCWRQAIG